MMRDPLTDPFSRETILVQSAGMAQWLQIQLAQDVGVAANISCPLPAAFIWRLFTQFFPGVPTENTFSKTAMAWKLMSLLPHYQNDHRFLMLNTYLANDPQQRKLYQLSQQIAWLFDYYLIYRPAWITAWQHGNQLPQLGIDQSWQAVLWQALAHYDAQLTQSDYHRANLFHAMIARLSQTQCLAPLLPKRLFVFSVSVLPPLFLQLLHAMARHIDIHMMLIEPCRHPWGKASTSPSNQPTIEHPLLAAWGQQGREQSCLLTQLDPVENDAMVDIVPDTLLHAIQSDLLERASNNAQSADHNAQYRLDPHDISLTLHACYSPLREVEVLHDNLLTFMNADATITLRDVVIMVTDLQQYAPYIQAVFSQVPTNRYLPFTISEQVSSDTQSIVRAYLQLLSLPNSRFQAEEVLSLLDVPAVATRFAIDECTLQRLRQWTTTSGIRWGLDDDQVADLQLPTNGHHTWQFGLTRMLLGYAMTHESGPFRGVLPYNNIDESDTELIGHLANFLAQLAEWRQRLAQLQPLSEWLPCCRQLLNAFFVRDTSSETTLVMLEKQWQQCIIGGIESHYDAPLSIALIQDALATQLEQRLKNEQFLTGSITFCSMMPMRTIPFKIICLLGMNDGSYPRPTTHLSFSLMSNTPCLGDHNRSSEDRYLFLETLISAQSTLYISYVGHSIQDNRSQHPSILVSELLDYCCQNYRLLGDDALMPGAAAQRLRQHLLHEHPLTPFDARCFQVNNRWQSYASEWLAVACDQHVEVSPFWQQPLAQQTTITELTLDALQQFYRHPVRSFFQQRLQVKFTQSNLEPLTTEPFGLNALERYQLNQPLLDTLINQGCIDQLYQHAAAAGKLPQGAFGLLLWQQQCQMLQPLVTRIRSQQLPAETCVIDITIDGIRLSGILPQMQADGLLRWRAVGLQITHGFELWLEHLLYCAMGYSGSSRLYGIGKSDWQFTALPPHQAIALLADLLDGWHQGQHQPLLLLLKCGWAWLQTLYHAPQIQLSRSPSQLRKAQQKLQQTWHGSRHCPGEGSDPYYQRLFRTLTSAHLEAITSNAERFLLPLARHQHTE